MSYIIKDKNGVWLFKPDEFKTEKEARLNLAFAIRGADSAVKADRYLTCKIVKKPKSK